VKIKLDIKMQSLTGSSNSLYGINYDTSTKSNIAYTIDLESGKSNKLAVFQFASGGWFADTFSASNKYISAYGSAGDLWIHDKISNKTESVVFTGYQNIKQTQEGAFYGVKFNNSSQLNEIYKLDIKEKTESKIADIKFPSGGWFGSSLGFLGDFAFALSGNSVVGPSHIAMIAIKTGDVTHTELSKPLQTIFSSDDEVYGVNYNDAFKTNQLYSLNTKSGAAQKIADITFPSGFWYPGSAGGLSTYTTKGWVSLGSGFKLELVLDTYGLGLDSSGVDIIGSKIKQNTLGSLQILSNASQQQLSELNVYDPISISSFFKKGVNSSKLLEAASFMTIDKTKIKETWSKVSGAAQF